MSTHPKFPRGIEVVGSAVIENPSGKILLVRSAKWGEKWVMPGGHIEPGETIEEAMLREVQEEVGLTLKSEGICSYGELIDSTDFDRPAHFIFFDIYCKAPSDYVKLDNEELTEYLWVDPKEALKMDLVEGYDKTIKDFLLFKKSKS